MPCFFAKQSDDTAAAVHPAARRDRCRLQLEERRNRNHAVCEGAEECRRGGEKICKFHNKILQNLLKKEKRKPSVPTGFYR